MASGVLTRLRSGVPADELHSPFDRRATAIYVIIGLQALAAAIFIIALKFQVRASVLIALPAWSVALLGAAMLLRRYGHGRASGIMEATALSYIQGLPSLILMFPLAALSAPFADVALARADDLLGFNAGSFAQLFAGKATGQYVLTLFYHSFNWQPLIVVPALFLSGRSDRGWQFATAGCLAAVAAAAIFPFAPAVGTFQHFHVAATGFPKIVSAHEFGDVLRLLKEQHVRVVTPALFTGFISFPSYHAAAAAIFAWAMWPFRSVRWLFVALNIAMCVSALIVGAHYLVDLIGGVLLGGAAVFASIRILPSGQLHGATDSPFVAKA